MIALSQPLLVMLALVIVYSVICRARHFDDTTFWYVKAQHAVAAVGALMSIVVPLEWSAVLIAGGTAGFLLLGTPRWRHDAPAGITKPNVRKVMHW